MSEPVHPLTLLSKALDQTGTVIAAIQEDQRALPTPCRSWDVEALTQHLLDDLEKFAVRARGGTPDWSTAKAGERETDVTDAYRKGADELLAAWRQAGDLTGAVELPGLGKVPARFPVDQQIAEFAVHSWDLARAVRQPTDLDPEVGAAALGWASKALRPEFRGDEADGKAFGIEVSVPADAPVYDRLAAFFGRTPG
jgi:uncharacterized protein (TIGR03086 family)